MLYELKKFENIIIIYDLFLKKDEILEKQLKISNGQKEKIQVIFLLMNWQANIFFIEIIKML
jgi:hypothetical protein